MRKKYNKRTILIDERTAVFDKALFGLPGAKRVLALLIVWSALLAGFAVGQVVSLAALVSALWAADSLHAQAGLLGCFIVCYLARQVVLYVRATMLGRYASKQAANLREQALAAVYDSRGAAVRRSGSGALEQAVLEGADQVRSYIETLMPKVSDLAVISIVLVVALFVVDVPSGVIALVAFPVAIMFFRIVGGSAKERAERQYASYQVLSNHFVDTLKGVDTLRAFGRAEAETASVFRVSERFRKATMRTLSAAMLSSAILDVVEVCAVAGISIMLCLRMLNDGLPLFTGLTALMLTPEYFKPMRDFSGDFHATLDGKNALADLLGIVRGGADGAPAANGAGADGAASAESAEREADGYSADTAGVTAAAADGAADRVAAGRAADAASRPCAPWGADSVLAFRGVRFSYGQVTDGESGSPGANGDRTATVTPASAASEGLSGDATSSSPDAVLANATFELRGFERVGVVGKSGSGKSTLMALISGFERPCAGGITVCGTPVETLGMPSWQRQVAYIPQHPYLFRATLRENLTLYNPEADDAAIARAIDALDLAPLVASLPQGLDTIVGDAGRTLSGGQAQRIALARALLDPTRRILLLDEPTEHLDIETERDLAERMLPLMEGRLVVFATHRLHWLAHMDRVLVIKDGVVTCDDEVCEHLRTEQADAYGTGAGDASASSGASTAEPAEARGAAADVDAASAPGTPTSPRRAGDRWVRPGFSAHRDQLLRALGLGLLTFACSMLMMFAAGYLICLTVDPDLTGLFALMVPIGFVQLFGIARPFVHYFERLTSHDWVLKLTSSMRAALYRTVARHRPKLARAYTAGDFLSLMADDIGHLQNLYLRTLFPCATACGLAVCAAVVFGVFDLAFALVMLLEFALLALVAPTVAVRATRERTRRRKHATDELYRVLADDVAGAADWVLSGRRADFLARHRARAAAVEREQRGLDAYLRASDLVTAAVFGIGAVLVVVWAQARFGGAVGGPASWIGAFVLGYFPLFEAFGPLARAGEQANEHRASIERLNSLPGNGIAGGAAAGEGVGEGERGSGAASAFGGDPTSGTSESNGKGEPERAQSVDLVFDGVTFAYPGEPAPVLRDFNLAIPAGQHVAVLGRSGAGKSTLVSLLRGDLTPDAGTVRVGRVRPSELGEGTARFVCVVQQAPYLFNRTLRDNLALGRPDATDDELLRAIDAVELSGLLARLPQGLDTMLAEGGAGLSGGERHRIALARILVAKAPAVVLDEPMVGLDPETEAALLETIRRVLADRTLVMVTHHLQGLDAFDRIVFVEDGRIALDGAPAKLARTSARYRDLRAFDQVADGLFVRA
ncbi:MAG: thiol reductant ABC exporter subunit CydC [Eggerthellaceae bacterium]